MINEPNYTLTLKEALEFSIAKWQAIVKNNGDNIDVEHKIELGIAGFDAACGLCEYQRERDEYLKRCPPYYEQGCHDCVFKEGELTCNTSSHAWMKWCHCNDLTVDKEALEYAEKILARLKRLLKKELKIMKERLTS